MNYKKVIFSAVLFEVVVLVLLITTLSETHRTYRKVDTIQNQLDSANVKIDSLQNEVYLLNCYLYD